MIQSDRNNLLVAAPFPPNCRNGLAKSTSGTAAPPKPCPSGKHFFVEWNSKHGDHPWQHTSWLT